MQPPLLQRSFSSNVIQARDRDRSLLLLLAQEPAVVQRLARFFDLLLATAFESIDHAQDLFTQ